MFLGNFLEFNTSSLLLGLNKKVFWTKILGLKLEFLLAVGIGSSFNFPSFEKL